jgi:hypothetical protein
VSAGVAALKSRDYKYHDMDGDAKMLKAGRWRQMEELKPIADKVAQNPELMDRLRSTIGSEDRDRAENIIHEIAIYAQRFDPNFGLLEGSRIALMLVLRLRQSEGPEATN